MAHFLNIIVEGGFKELGNPSLTSLYLESESDEDCEEYEVKVTSQRPFTPIH